MIDQHIYIKTGIGLETHAKSPSLTDAFINTNIRPFYSSLDLFYLDGKDSPGYKSLIPLSDGSILIGSGVKADNASFSFIHNLIIPQDDAEKIAVNPAALLYAPSSDIASFQHLPALSSVSSESGRDSYYKRLFSALNIAHGEYMCLLAAVFAAVEQNRKVFIALPRKTSVDEICAVMYGIYEKLPHYLRYKTGFTTLFGETEIRPEIPLYFIPDDKIIRDKDLYRIENYNASKDFVFNFGNKSFFHIKDLKQSLEEEFFTLASEYIKDGRSLVPFFGFAEEASENLPHERRLSLRFYNDLSCIYTLSDNEEALPLKLGRLTIIFSELLRSGGGKLVLKYFSEFIKLYRRFIKQKNASIPPEILKRLVSCYDFCEEEQKNELYDILTLDIDICLKDSENELLFMHIDALRVSTSLYNKIIENKMAPSNRLIKRYFTYLIDQRKTVHSLIEFADGFFSEMPQIADNELIRTMICDRAKELYDTSGDRFEAVKYLEEKCLQLVDKYPDNADIFSAIYRYALVNYLNALDLSELNCAKIEKFPLTDGETINEECTVKHKIALAAKEILALTDDLAMSFISYDAFGFENVRKNLSDSDREGKLAEERLKALLLRCIKEKKDAPRRIIYIILFYIYETKDSRNQNDFDSILDFLGKELSVPPFEFIEWYLSSELFIVPMSVNGRIVRAANLPRADLTMLTAFYESLRKYFIKHSSLLSNDRNLKKMKKEMEKAALAHPDFRELTQQFRKVLSGIVSEHYSPVKRLINKIVSAKNFKFTVLITCIAVILIGGFAIGGLFSATSDKETVIDTLTESSESEKIFVTKTGWGAYKLTKDGEYIPAVKCVDDLEDAETLDFAKDASIVVSVPNSEGIIINGLSISAVLSGENEGFDVYVYDENGKRFSVGVSDYDTSTGASLYAFTEAECIKKIELTPRSENGTLTVKEISAYVTK